MRKFFRGGGDFGGPVTEGGSHAKRLGATALDSLKQKYTKGSEVMVWAHTVWFVTSSFPL